MPEADRDAARLVTLGATLEQRRRDAGRSAREVALEVGISPVYLRVIETGKNAKTGRASRPSAEILVRLSRALEIEPDAVLEQAGYEGLRAEHAGDAQTSGESGREMASELESIADAIEHARMRPSDFMRDLVGAEVLRFENHLTALASGSFTCGPADEPRIRRLALLDACHRSLQAVSFADDAWWLGPAGTGHTALHARIAARENPPVMTRIFLLKFEDRPTYENALRAHADAGVVVLLAEPGDVADVDQRDLEIYDRALLREAGPGGGSSAGRYAEFTDDHVRLKRAESAFAAIRHVAIPFPRA